MKNVSKNPKICFTAGGILIHRNKVLLIKHKKLGIWLSPGGHVDEGELPHQTAEREFLEETGIKVKAVEPFFNLPTRASHSTFKSRYYPSPIMTNLHWVCKQNFKFRVYGKGKPDKRWSRGCEQHLGFTYLMELFNKNKPLKLEFNQKETTDIGWFSLGELEKLSNLNSEIKWEIQQAFKVVSYRQGVYK